MSNKTKSPWHKFGDSLNEIMWLPFGWMLRTVEYDFSHDGSITLSVSMAPINDPHHEWNNARKACGLNEPKDNP